MHRPPSYFDHNATTPVRPEVCAEMVRVMQEASANPSSIHQAGQHARHVLETARRRTAAWLGCEAKEIVFTGGGTEASNIAILGFARQRPGTHIVTTAIEHPAVLNPCAQLEKEGFAVTYVGVSRDGVVDPDDIRRALRPNTALVSLMHANNEIGTLQPIADVITIAHEVGVAVHCDGVQAAGKVPVNLRALGVDLYNISAHKFYGPKGCGALFVRKGTVLKSVLYGGRHEHGLRPGTENVAAAAGLAKAAELATATDPALRDRFEQQMLALVPDVIINGAGAPRLPNTSNLCFPGIEGEAMVIALDLRGFAVSSGSACSSGAVEPSHVLMAIGLSRKDAKSSIRISLGASNTEADVDALAEALSECASHLRKLSPEYSHAG
ncbi:MAG: cysteine desulfurase family protein [Bryobacteraceae bacterium]